MVAAFAVDKAGQDAEVDIFPIDSGFEQVAALLSQDILTVKGGTEGFQVSA